MRVDQHWNRCQDRLKYHCLGRCPNFDWASWSNVEVSPALSRDLDKRPPNLLSPLKLFSDFKNDAVVLSSVSDSCGWKASFGRVWWEICPTSVPEILSAELYVCRGQSTDKNGWSVHPAAYLLPCHTLSPRNLLWTGWKLQAQICLCNLRISVHLWRYRLFPKCGGMPL